MVFGHMKKKKKSNLVNVICKSREISFNFLLKWKLSLKIKRDTNTNIIGKTTLWYKRYNPGLRWILSVKSDEVQWGEYKPRSIDGKIHRVSWQSHNRACTKLWSRNSHLETHRKRRTAAHPCQSWRQWQWKSHTKGNHRYENDGESFTQRETIDMKILREEGVERNWKYH